MQARDPKPGQPLPGRPARPSNAPGYGSMIRSRDPRYPLPRATTVPRPAPRPPLFTHAEPATSPTQTPRYPGLPGVRSGFGLPSLRRNVCPHFYMTGSRGAIPIQAPHLLKALIRQEQNVSRCQLRGGVHLEQGYVNDVCLTPRFNQCVFYEDDLSKD